MKISWIFPQTEQCGIAIYSRNYCNALKHLVDIRMLAPSEFIMNGTHFIDSLNETDLIHIQYEPSFFFNGNACYYKKLVTAIKKPIVVSLHEVYKEDPHAFPRSQIRGIFRPLKLLRYDFNHPFQTAYKKHLKKMFYANSILVHHNYQASILENSGIDKKHIHVFNHPIKLTENISTELQNGVLHMGMTGFINPDYDYELLFTILENIDIEWKFSWIGGLRTHEHQQLLNSILSTIEKRNWQNKFVVTGWVSASEQTRQIASLDCALALFKNRSTSSSVSCILGALKPIISTQLPLFNDINDSFNQFTNEFTPLIIIKNNPGDIINELKTLKSDTKKYSEKLEKFKSFINTSSYENMSQKLFNLYRKVIYK